MSASERRQAPVPCFIIGRDAAGFWAARSADGREGGLFVSRDEAEKFARGLARARGGAVARSGEPLSLWRAS
jgi:hypothetical protein